MYTDEISKDIVVGFKKANLRVTWHFSSIGKSINII